jgi:hypothetical protein
MQVGQPVAIAFDHGAHALGHAAVRIDVEQDATGVAHERVGPGGYDDSADETDHRIHPGPAEHAAEQQADDDENGDGRIG